MAKEYDNQMQLKWLEQKNYDELFKSVENFIRRKAFQYRNIIPDQEEAYAMGCETFVNSLTKYDQTRNDKYISFLGLMLDSCFLMAARKEKQLSKYNITSLDTVVKTSDNGSDITLAEVIPDSIDIFEQVENKINKEKFIQACKILNSTESDILQMRIEGKTQKEICLQLSISQSYVSRLEKKIINKLKKYINEKEEVNMSRNKEKKLKKAKEMFEKHYSVKEICKNLDITAATFYIYKKQWQQKEGSEVDIATTAKTKMESTSVPVSIMEEKPKKTVILKITSVASEHNTYIIQNEQIVCKNETGSFAFLTKDIDNYIEELKALKELING